MGEPAGTLAAELPALADVAAVVLAVVGLAAGFDVALLALAGTPAGVSVAGAPCPTASSGATVCPVSPVPPLLLQASRLRLQMPTTCHVIHVLVTQLITHLRYTP